MICQDRVASQALTAGSNLSRRNDGYLTESAVLSGKVLVLGAVSLFDLANPLR